LWDIAKRIIDDSTQNGLYIFTGSSTPTDNTERHDGAGRFSAICMENLTLQEMNCVEKNVEFISLFTHNYKIKDVNVFKDISNEECIKMNFNLLSRGGFVKNFIQNLDEATCINKNKDYVNQICKQNRRDEKNTVLFSFSKNIMGKVIKEVARNTGQEINKKVAGTKCGIN
jgi:hypothetical protein